MSKRFAYQKASPLIETLPPRSSRQESDPLSIGNGNDLCPRGLRQHRNRLLQQRNWQIRKFRGDRRLYDLVECHDGVKLTGRGRLRGATISVYNPSQP